MKVVLNDCFGGFGLSTKALMLYVQKTYGQVYLYYLARPTDIVVEYISDLSKLPKKASSHDCFVSPNFYGKRAELSKINVISDYSISRNDQNLVEVVQTLGDEANGSAAKLKIETVFSKGSWKILEHDGKETLRAYADKPVLTDGLIYDIIKTI